MPTSAIGSGLDIPGLVSSLVNASRAPTAKRISAANAASSAKLSAIGQIKSAMTKLQGTLDALQQHMASAAFRAHLPKDAALEASASNTAAPGRYQVEAVQLASAHKLVSQAGYPQAQTFGNGSIHLSVGSGDAQMTRTIEVAPEASLTEIASAINDAFADEGVSASIITSDDGQHLSLTATESGKSNQISITTSGDAELQALVDGLVTQRPAQDAVVRVDGLERSASNNHITDLIPGVNLNLTRAAPGEIVDLDIQRDLEPLKSCLNDFASAWNSANQLLKSSSAYNPETRSAAILSGDSLVRGMQQQLRAAVSQHSVPLRELGISLDKAGVMALDTAAFEATHTAQPERLAGLFGPEGRYSTQLRQMLDSQLDSGNGSLTLRNKTLNQQIRAYKQQMEQLDTKMEKLNALYTAQFTAMETTISKLQSGASAIDQLLKSTTH